MKFFKKEKKANLISRAQVGNYIFNLYDDYVMYKNVGAETIVKFQLGTFQYAVLSNLIIDTSQEYNAEKRKENEDALYNVALMSDEFFCHLFGLFLGSNEIMNRISDIFIESNNNIINDSKLKEDIDKDELDKIKSFHDATGLVLEKQPDIKYWH